MSELRLLKFENPRAESVSCQTCKHRATSHHWAYCHSPKAVKHDRVRGDVYPTLHLMGAHSGLNDELLKNCDRGGWYEKARVATDWFSVAKVMSILFLFFCCGMFAMLLIALNR